MWPCKLATFRHQVCLTAALALTLIGPAHPADSPRTITWIVNDWPPEFMFKEGKPPRDAADLGAGHQDRVMAALIARLPNYVHAFKVSMPTRLWTDMRHGQQICWVSAMRTPDREAWAYFTPATLNAPPALVMRKDTWAQLKITEKPVSLAWLRQQPGLSGAFQANRSYGASIDALLPPMDSPLRERNSGNGQLPNLVASGRFDYTIEYPQSIEYARGGRSLGDKLRVLPIEEASEWVTGHVACTKSSWGRAVIKDIDAAIRDAAATPAYRAATSTWLPGSVREAAARQIEAFYNARMRASMVSD